MIHPGIQKDLEETSEANAGVLPSPWECEHSLKDRTKSMSLSYYSIGWKEKGDEDALFY